MANSNRRTRCENPTVKVANMRSRSVTGHDVTQQPTQTAGATVHCRLGASIGTLFGLPTEVAHAAPTTAPSLP